MDISVLHELEEWLVRNLIVEMSIHAVLLDVLADCTFGRKRSGSLPRDFGVRDETLVFFQTPKAMVVTWASTWTSPHETLNIDDARSG